MDKFFNYKSSSIHYSLSGSGTTIMLIHGYLETSEIWNGFAKKLSEKFRVITVDLPGHGKSKTNQKILTMEFMASVLAELIKAQNIRKIFLAGHSLGGYITLAFAELYPELLTGYCLLHSHPFADDKEKIEKRNIDISVVGKGNKEWFIPGSIKRLFADNNVQKFNKELNRATGIGLKIPGDTIVSILKGMIERPSRVNVMESGSIPYLWVLGAFDNLIDYKVVQSKVHIPENAQVEVLQNSGHMGFIEEEARALKILTEFVSKLE